MPYGEPGNTQRITAAGAAFRHGDAVADEGFVGTGIKTTTPSQDVVRADRDLVIVGEGYNMLIRGIREYALGGLTPAKGDLIFIVVATNALDAAAGAGKVPLGRVAYLAGERGTPTGRMRVNLDEKV